MHQSLQGATFHVEHIVPRSLGGMSELGNLAWACPGCNLRKSMRTEAPDPESGRVVLLFHPRANKWSEHFVWQSHSVIGLTPVGRATVAAPRPESSTAAAGAPRRGVVRIVPTITVAMQVVDG
jgi:hypothetical protein